MTALIASLNFPDCPKAGSRIDLPTIEAASGTGKPSVSKPYELEILAWKEQQRALRSVYEQTRQAFEKTVAVYSAQQVCPVLSRDSTSSADDGVSKGVGFVDDHENGNATVER